MSQVAGYGRKLASAARLERNQNQTLQARCKKREVNRATRYERLGTGGENEQKSAKARPPNLRAGALFAMCILFCNWKGHEKKPVVCVVLCNCGRRCVVENGKNRSGSNGQKRKVQTQ